MTWVAAEAAGNPIEGFGYGARVEYDLTDGTTVHGRIVVAGTDKVGEAHGVELDTDRPGDEMHWIGTILVRREGDTPAAPKAPRGPHLSPSMGEALDQLTGTPNGQVRKGGGITVQTARALHRRGLAFLVENHYTNGDWLLVVVEPEVQEVTDEGLLDLPVAEAALLAPLDPKRRYRAQRHAHIVAALGQADVAAGYPTLAQTYLQALEQRVGHVVLWQTGVLSDRQYGRFTDHAGAQWKAAREVPTGTWYAGTGWGEAVLTVEAPEYDAAHAAASDVIAADPVGYRELIHGFGLRRLTVGELVADRRAGKATGRK